MVYASAEDAALDLEVIDIKKHVYQFYDSTGRVLEARASGRRVTLHPTPRVASDLSKLRNDIQEMLKLLGAERADLLHIPFSDLVRLLLEVDQSKKKSK